MVLNFSSMSNLFPNSRAEGDGYGANVEQRRRNEGGLGPASLTLLHSGSGKSNSAVEIPLDSHTFAKGDILTNETIIVMVLIIGADVIKLTGSYKGSSTSTADIMKANPQYYNAIIYQRPANSKALRLTGYESRPDGLLQIDVAWGFGADDIITKAWTITLSGNHVDGSAYFNYRWWIYRRGQLF